MPDSTVYVRAYHPPENDPAFAISRREIWRYAGYAGLPDQSEERLAALLEEVIRALNPVYTYQVCWQEIPLAWEGESVRLPFSCSSKNLSKCLMGSDTGIVFAATVGLGPDRVIARFQRTDPVKALLAQACGAERVEALCDAFCADIEREACKGYRITNRFSPGYGDVPLAVQREIFRFLRPEKRIGVNLNESLLMSPSKSVTAIFGIGEHVARPRGGNKCSRCTNIHCENRRIDS